jgi:hypothetical protein
VRGCEWFVRWLWDVVSEEMVVSLDYRGMGRYCDGFIIASALSCGIDRKSRENWNMSVKPKKYYKSGIYIK